MSDININDLPIGTKIELYQRCGSFSNGSKKVVESKKIADATITKSIKIDSVTKEWMYGKEHIFDNDTAVIREMSIKIKEG